jgi:anti-anti-sigma regulatory factor
LRWFNAFLSPAIPSVQGSIMTQTLVDLTRLELDGALTTRFASALHARLQTAVAAHRWLAIDCAAAEDVDLSFIQLLIAARVSARALGHEVGLARAADGVLRAALLAAGLRGCAAGDCDGDDASGDDGGGDEKEALGADGLFWFTGAAT